VHANMLASSPQTVVDALREVVGGTWQVRCESRHAGDSQPDGPLPSPESSTGAQAFPRPAEDGEDAGWPEPARPGGGAAAGVGGAEEVGPPTPAGPGKGRQAQPARSGSRPAKAPAKPVAVPVDEQVDELTDEHMPAQSGEQQALELLQRTLGAEKIGEVAP
jgi:DNA polymerase III subunit gamma/tau